MFFSFVCFYLVLESCCGLFWGGHSFLNYSDSECHLLGRLPRAVRDAKGGSWVVVLWPWGKLSGCALASSPALTEVTVPTWADGVWLHISLLPWAFWSPGWFPVKSEMAHSPPALSPGEAPVQLLFCLLRGAYRPPWSIVLFWKYKGFPFFSSQHTFLDNLSFS